MLCYLLCQTGIVQEVFSPCSSHDANIPRKHSSSIQIYTTNSHNGNYASPQFDPPYKIYYTLTRRSFNTHP